MRVLFAIVLGICTVTSSAVAQRDEAFGVRVRTDTATVSKQHGGGIRVLSTVGGVFFGAIAGGYLGYNVLPHNCACDDPGLDELVSGALVGMTIGAAIGAAVPDLGSACSFDKRLMRSLAGAALAAGAAYFVAGGSRNEGTVLAVPAGAIGGSLAALGRCWKSG